MSLEDARSWIVIASRKLSDAQGRMVEGLWREPTALGLRSNVSSARMALVEAQEHLMRAAMLLEGIENEDK